MTFEEPAFRFEAGDWEAPSKEPFFGASTETGRLREVLLARPNHLQIVPCNAVARDGLAKGYSTCSPTAQRQHRELETALAQAGVRCRFVPPSEGMADLSFTRDPVVMTPWGAIGLRLAEPHRRAETDHVLATLARMGVSVAGRIDRGHVEGGDVCLLREGLVLIGISGERTDEVGARTLGTMFKDRGWQALYTQLDAEHLHLDTILAMASDDCAVACVEALEPALLAELERLGIALIPASLDEVAGLRANILSLGGERVIANNPSRAMRAALESRGITTIAVDLGEFAKCGGGPHCLTLPLARA